jgi:methionyl-tRNA synthetase
LSDIHAAKDSIAQAYDAREYGKAAREIMLLADKVNAYVDQHKPWDLAKDAANNEALHQVCSLLINAFAELSRYLAPVLPSLAQAVEAFTGTSMQNWNAAGYVTHIQPYQHLMQRVTPEQLEALFEPPAVVEEKVTPGGEEIAPTISIDDFAKRWKARPNCCASRSTWARAKRAMCSAASPACTSPKTWWANSPSWWPTWPHAR